MKYSYQDIITAGDEVEFSTRLRASINEDVDALVEQMIGHEAEHQSFRTAIATKYVNQGDFVERHGGREELLDTTEQLISFFTHDGYKQFVHLQKADMLLDDINNQPSTNNVIVKIITQKAVIDFKKKQKTT
ncbi:MAG: hypothetical protein ACKKL4_01410 [Patescibacteria group bacterium]